MKLNIILHQKPVSMIQEKYIALAVSFGLESFDIRHIWGELAKIIFTLNEKKDFTVSLKADGNTTTLKFYVQNNSILFEMKNN